MDQSQSQSQSQMLIRAAQKGNLNSLYELISQDPRILEDIDAVPFIETPLHLAASLRQTLFAVEIMILRPTLGRKLNQNGLSPLHLCVRNGDMNTIRGLLAIDKELVNVKGREGITPLHYAVIEGRVDLLVEMLSACSANSVKALTAQRETLLHLAVKKNQYDAFKVLLENINFIFFDTEEILLWKDDKGHTVLHLATQGLQFEMIKLLCGTYRYNPSEFGINIMDEAGQTAMDILQRHEREEPVIQTKIMEILRNRGATKAADLLHFESSYAMKWRKLFETYRYRVDKSFKNDSQNARLVVAVLINAASFQIGVNPPGGFWQDTTASTATKDDEKPHVAGTSILATTRPLLFQAMTFFNLMGFVSSVLMILFLTRKLPLRIFLVVSVFSLSVTYMCSLVTVSGLSSGGHQTVSSTYLPPIIASAAFCSLSLFIMPVTVMQLLYIRRYRQQ